MLAAISLATLLAALVLGLVPGAREVHGVVALMALLPPLGATAHTLASRRAGYALLALWALALALSAATIADRGDWTFYTPYSTSSRFDLDRLALLAPPLVLAIGAAAGAWWSRAAPFTAVCLGLAALVGVADTALVLASGGAPELYLGGTLAGLDIASPLLGVGLVLPAIGVLAIAARRARWRGAPLAWLIVALTTLTAGIVTELDIAGNTLVLHDTMVVVGSLHHLLLAAASGLLGSIRGPGTRAGVASAIAFGIGAQLVGAAGLIGGMAGLPRRYASYLDDEVGATLATVDVLHAIGGLLVISAVAWVAWSALRLHQRTGEPL